ncbi:MAG: DUF2127 domain-containing protein [Candidatus Woesearchaeota archaeon]
MMHHVKRILEHRLVKLVIYLKGAIGILQALAGVILLLIGPNTISSIIEKSLEGDVEKSNGIVNRILVNLSETSSVNIHIFAALFMIVHGVVFIAAVFALIHKRMWAFPAAGLLLLLFIIYQVYHLSREFSFLMMILTFIDLVIFTLLSLEYRRLRMTEKELFHQIGVE